MHSPTQFKVTHWLVCVHSVFVCFLRPRLIENIAIYIVTIVIILITLMDSFVTITIETIVVTRIVVFAISQFM